MRLMIALRDAALARATAAELRDAGFGTDAVRGIDEARAALACGHYDLVVAEARLPDGCAVDWLRGRHTPAGTFVIVLAEGEEERVAALEAGADDAARCVVSRRELLARVRAVLRRPRALADSRLTLGDLSLCTVGREASVAGRPLAMQRRETAILEALLRRGGRVVPRPLLEQDIYGLQAEVCPNSLEVRISRIRRQLAGAGSAATIETVRGVGYRILVAAQAHAQAA